MSWVVIVGYARTAWRWLRQNSTAVLLAIIGCFTGAALIRRKDSKINSLKDALAAQKASSEIHALEAKREELIARDRESEAYDHEKAIEQRKLEMRIAARKRDLLTLHQPDVDPNTLSDQELEDRFRRAGL